MEKNVVLAVLKCQGSKLETKRFIMKQLRQKYGQISEFQNSVTTVQKLIPFSHANARFTPS